MSAHEIIYDVVRAEITRLRARANDLQTALDAWTIEANRINYYLETEKQQQEPEHGEDKQS